MPHKVESLMAENVKVPNDGDFYMAGKPLKAAGGLHWDQVNSRLGVGTDTPSDKLHVTGRATIGNSYVGTWGANSDYTAFQHTSLSSSSAGTYALLHSATGATYINSVSNQPIYFRENNVDKMVLTGGKLGIGTNSPDTPLAIESNSFHGLSVKRTSAGGGSAIEFINGDGDEWSVGAGGTGTFGIYNGVTFGQQFTIDTSGNVGIGTTSPGYTLDVDGTVNTGALTATSVSGDGSGLTSLNADNLGSGTVPSVRLSLTASDIPSLDADKITTGTLARPINTTTGTFSGDIKATSFVTGRVILAETWPNASLVGDLGTWVSSTWIIENYTGTSPDGYRVISFKDDGNLTSPTFDVRKYALVDSSDANDAQTKTSTRLFLKCWLYSDSLDDEDTEPFFYIEFSPDNGTTWYEVYRDNSNEDSGTDAGYKMAVADLSPYIDATNSTNAKIRFRGASPGGGDYYRVGRILVYESDVPTNLGGMWLGAGGNIGIGTTSPGYTLDVDGTVNTGALTATTGAFSDDLEVTGTLSTKSNVSLGVMSGYETEGTLKFSRADGTDRVHNIKVYNSSTQASNYMKFQIHAGGTGTGAFTDNVLYLRGDGNVGIGTASPGYKLDVNGTVNTGALTATSVSGDGSGLTNLDADNINAGTLTRPINTSTGLFTHVSLGTDKYPTLGGNWLTIYSQTFDGNIGVNHPDPDGGILFTNTSSTSRFPWGYYMGVVKDVASTSGTSQRFDIGKSNDLNSQDSTEGSDSLTPYLTIDNGNVGIGTTSPAYTLDVHGTSNVGALTATSATVPNDGDFVMAGKPLKSAVGLQWDRVNSRLGVGTNSPAYKLEVNGTVKTGTLTVDGNIDFTPIYGGQGDTNKSGMIIFNKPAGESIDTSANIDSIYYDDSEDAYHFTQDAGKYATGNAKLVFGSATVSGAVNTGALTATTGTFSEDLAVGTNKLFVDVSTSNVGIGTASPSYKLDVNGMTFSRWGMMIGDSAYGHTQHKVGVIDISSGNPNLTLIFQMRKTNNWIPGIIKLYWTKINADSSGVAGGAIVLCYYRYTASGINTFRASSIGDYNGFTIAYSTASAVYDEIQVTAINGVDRIIADVEVSDVYGFVA